MCDVVRDTLVSYSLKRGSSVGVGHAVAVLFDVDSEQRILEASDAVGEGVDLREMGAHPHVSLGVFRSAVDVDILATCVATLARVTEPFQLRLSAVGSFPGDEGVVFLALAPTERLLNLHHRFHAMLVEHGISTDPLYRPDRWVPHCTVAQAVPDERVGTAVERVRRTKAFGSVTVVSINLTEFLPVRELVAHPVIGGSDPLGST